MTSLSLLVLSKFALGHTLANPLKKWDAKPPVCRQKLSAFETYDSGVAISAYAVLSYALLNVLKFRFTLNYVWHFVRQTMSANKEESVMKNNLK